MQFSTHVIDHSHRGKSQSDTNEHAAWLYSNIASINKQSFEQLVKIIMVIFWCRDLGLQFLLILFVYLPFQYISSSSKHRNVCGHSGVCLRGAELHPCTKSDDGCVLSKWITGSVPASDRHAHDFCPSLQLSQSVNEHSEGAKSQQGDYSHMLSWKRDLRGKKTNGLKLETMKCEKDCVNTQSILQATKLHHSLSNQWKRLYLYLHSSKLMC